MESYSRLRCELASLADTHALRREMILATGSTAVNATMQHFVGEKPVVFYGVTVAAIARIHGYARYCPCAY